MIFDDYGLGGPELTQKGIDGFLSGYHKKLQYIWEKGSQVIIQKKKIYHEKSIISARNGQPIVEPIGRLKPTFHRA